MNEKAEKEGIIKSKIISYLIAFSFNSRELAHRHSDNRLGPRPKDLYNSAIGNRVLDFTA